LLRLPQPFLQLRIFMSEHRVHILQTLALTNMLLQSLGNLTELMVIITPRWAHCISLDSVRVTHNAVLVLQLHSVERHWMI
jgi:hypothetical protein